MLNKKRWILFFCLCLPWIGFAATQKPLINIQHWQTRRGAKVYFVAEKQLPMVDVRVIFRAGSAEDSAHAGIASLVGAMLPEGTQQLTQSQIALNFDKSGAIFTKSVSRDKAFFNLRSLTDEKYLQPALMTFSQVLTAPVFPKKSLARLRTEFFVALKQQQQSPLQTAMLAFYRTLYAGLPYAHNPLGNPKSLTAISVAQLQKFYQRYYVAQNAIVVIVGDIHKIQAKIIAQSLMGHLANGKPAPENVLATKSPKPKTLRIPFPAQQSTVVVGQVGISHQSPNYFPLRVGNDILGANQLTSRLFQVLRNQNGLVYFVSSSFVAKSYRGPFFVVLQTQNDKTQKAIKLLMTTLHKFILNGPSPQRLQQAKKSIVNSFMLSLASNSAIINNISNIVFYHLPLNYLDTYREKIEKVSLSQVKQAFLKTLNTKNMLTVIVGPNQKADEHK